MWYEFSLPRERVGGEEMEEALLSRKSKSQMKAKYTRNQ